MAFQNESKVQQFVDLCTISNVSVVILHEYVHGYYLYGEAPWRSSDIPLDYLATELNKERQGKYKNSRTLKENKRNSDKGV